MRGAEQAPYYVLLRAICKLPSNVRFDDLGEGPDVKIAKPTKPVFSVF